MIKNAIKKIITYLALFFCLSLAEKELGLYGVSIGVLFGLIYCREKGYYLLPCYLVAATVVPLSVEGVIFCSATCVVGVIDLLIHKWKKARYSFFEIGLLIVISMVPYVCITAYDGTSGLIRITVSILSSLAAGYIGVVAGFPVLIRGLRYKPTSGELFALGTVLCLCSIGLSSVALFHVQPYFFFVGLAYGFILLIDKKILLPFAVATALGSSLPCGTEVFCTLVATALIVLPCGNKRIAFSSLVGAVGYFLLAIFFYGKIDFYSAIPFAIGIFIVCFLPKRVKNGINLSGKGYVGRYAMRTVVNRDREDVSERIKSLSTVFSEMQDILIGESHDATSISTLTDAVCGKVCAECRYCVTCVEIFDVRGAVEKLIESGLEKGKATLLDVGVKLGDNCKMIAKLLSAVNETVVTYKVLETRRESVDRGRDMIISQMGGVANLLDNMAKSIKLGLSFDADREEELVSRLSQANIIATDVMLYKGEQDEVTVVVREKDGDKPALSAIISQVVGIKMAEYSRKTEINNLISITYCRAPKYKVVYGEHVYAKESRCGDTREAVKVGKNKLMFVLSDGMGTGEKAFFTASSVIFLIERFYKAGFDHRTIFTGVSSLLSLRTEENFSALDVAVVDLTSGEIDFIKQGGRESYILTRNGCEEIEGGTLPMGIVESEPVVTRRALSVDDSVVLMSDGVADYLNGEEIRAIAEEVGARNPKAVADGIVESARRKAGDRVDDMTVMVLRLISR